MRTARSVAIVVAALAFAVGSGAAWATTYTWNVAGPANWSVNTNWTPTSGPPASAADSGMLDSGTATANADLGSVGDWPLITVAIGGTLRAPDATRNNPITLAGGTLQKSGTWGATWAGDITLAADTTSKIYGQSGTHHTLNLTGTISGSGALELHASITLTSSREIVINGNNSSLTGDVTIAEGYVRVKDSVNALGTNTGSGIVTVNSGARLLQDIDNLNRNIVMDGGTYLIERSKTTTGTFSLVTGKDSIFTVGGGGFTFSETANLDGLIQGDGRLVFESSRSNRVLRIRGTANTYKGGTWVMGTNSGVMIATNEGALGTGAIRVDADGNLRLVKDTAADWTLANDLTGAGNIRVQTGTDAYRLTSAGALVSPGTSAGILTIEGKYAFGLDNGSNRATFLIDIEGAGGAGNAGITYDQLLVDHGDLTLAQSLVNANLVVDTSALPVAPNPLDEYIILSAPGAAFSNTYQFSTVTWLGIYTGDVIYRSGEVVLTDLHEPLPVAEPAGLSLVGLALLARRRRRR